MLIELNEESALGRISREADQHEKHREPNENWPWYCERCRACRGREHLHRQFESIQLLGTSITCVPFYCERYINFLLPKKRRSTGLGITWNDQHQV